MKSLFFFRVLFVATVLCMPSVFAGEAPHFGIAYNTKEASSLVYSCVENGKESLDCEFNQTSVRKNADPVNLPAEIYKAERLFSNVKASGLEDCDAHRAWIDVLLSKKKAPTREIEENIRNLSGIERMDWIRFANAMADFCVLRTEESHLNLIHVEQAKEARTCTVSSHTFREDFQLVREGSSATEIWIAKSKPSGPCGIIRLSRFEPVKPQNSKSIVWKYVTRTMVSDKQARQETAMCTASNESETVYSWKGQERALGCDYIELAAPAELIRTQKPAP